MRTRRPEMVLDLGQGDGATAAAAEHVTAPTAQRFLYGDREVPVRVQVAELELEPTLQPRDKMDPGTVVEYAALLAEAAAEGLDQAEVFDDPLIVYVDPVTGRKRVAEGYHRTSSVRLRAEKDGKPQGQLLAIFRPGGLTEARLWAAGSNKGHGLRRRAEDRRRVLLWFLDDEKGVVTLTPELLQRFPPDKRDKIPVGKPITASDHVIAALCQVSQPTVSRLRADLKRERAGGAPTDAANQTGAPAVPEKRMGLDGKERRVPVRPPQKDGAAARRELAHPDLAAARRNEDAPPKDGVRCGADLDVHDPQKIVDWRQMGAAWARKQEGQVPTDKTELRRLLAASYLVELACAKWGAVMARGQGDRVRDQALHALVEGAMRAAHGPRPARKR